MFTVFSETSLEGILKKAGAGTLIVYPFTYGVSHTVNVNNSSSSWG